MYTALLHVHSLLRWLVFGLLVACSVWGIVGLVRASPWPPAFRKVQAALVGTFHLQFLLGMGLYLGASPLVKAAFSDFGAAMSSPLLRFWSIEHLSLMVFALIVAQVTAIKAKRAVDQHRKWRQSALGFTLALILVCAGIPWPFREHVGRALLPF